MTADSNKILRGKFPGVDLTADTDVRSLPVFVNCEIHGKWKRHETMDSPALHPDCPDCIADRKMAGAFDRAAIPPRYRSRSLKSYQVTNDGQRQAFEIAQTYAVNITRNIRDGQNLLFIGTVGTGKTHLACGIAREALDAGHSALYVRVADLVSMVRETWRPDSKRSERKVYREICDVDLLIIDEVGVQAGSENEQQILFNVINKRNEEMRPLILISNLDAAGVKKMLGERSYDRVAENGRAVTFKWESYRRAK